MKKLKKNFEDKASFNQLNKIKVIDFLRKKESIQ